MKKLRLFLALVFLATTLTACDSVTAPDDCCPIEPGGTGWCCD